MDMNIRFGIFGLLLGITVLAAVSPPGVYGEEKVYTVQKGETLFSIAQGLGIKPDDLMKYNGITNPARLQAGQRLKIPGVSSAPGAVPAEKTGVTGTGSGGAYTIYRVTRGDTFYSIARKFSVTVEAIRQANSLSGTYVLR
ncbi:MAG: LysM peptidoglycan-binding domain-containing protein, partial [Treponema sp.]|nr:LysM peptidoglycan-binding domain-containing protein [Treponema sp.]